MNYLKLYILVLMLFAGFSVKSSGEVVSQKTTKTALLSVIKKGGVKRAPSRLFVECVYENGYLHFNATFSYTYMNVSISDEYNGSVVYHTITPADNTVMFDADNGVYEITAESDNGNTFTGTLQF